MKRLACLLALVAPACDTQTRACSPAGGDGCATGERCVVDEDGAPVCEAPDPAISVARLGEPCDGPNACADERAGCLTLYGISRCLPFCSPDTAGSDAPCDLGSPLGVPGECLAVLPDRPDLGACVFACEPAAPFLTETAPDDAVRLNHCPVGATCAVPYDLARAVCSAHVGPATAGGARCGPEDPCPPGWLCAPYDTGGRCREAVGPEDACDPAAGCTTDGRCDADAEWDRPLPEAPDYAVCVPCAVVARSAGPGVGERFLSACRAAEAQSEAFARCKSEGGRLATLDPVDTPRNRALAAAVPADLWGEPLWVSGEGEGCAALDPTTGRIQTVDCGRAAHALCELGG